MYFYCSKLQKIDFLFFTTTLHTVTWLLSKYICRNYQLSLVFCLIKLHPWLILTMKSWEVEGLSIDDKYEIEEFRVIMKDFADAATEGNLEEVHSCDLRERER